jgi:hypothetical protein
VPKINTTLTALIWDQEEGGAEVLERQQECNHAATD